MGCSRKHSSQSCGQVTGNGQVCDPVFLLDSLLGGITFVKPQHRALLFPCMLPGGPCMFGYGVGGGGQPFCACCWS